MSFLPHHKTFFSLSSWLKGLQLLICGWLLTSLIPVVTLLCALQFIFLLCTGAPQAFLTVLGGNLHRYTQELIGFLSFQTHRPPFPFS